VVVCIERRARVGRGGLLRDKDGAREEEVFFFFFFFWLSVSIVLHGRKLREMSSTGVV
jgi:hypothetical protein